MLRDCCSRSSLLYSTFCPLEEVSALLARIFAAHQSDLKLKMLLSLSRNTRANSCFSKSDSVRPSNVTNRLPGPPAFCNIKIQSSSITIELKIIPTQFTMLTTSFSRDRHYSMLSSTTMTNRVPPKRCLFGVPNPKETIDLLQEALDLERTRFARRWGIDPREDKENLCVRTERSPRKRTVPYSRQNNLHG